MDKGRDLYEKNGNSSLKRKNLYMMNLVYLIIVFGILALYCLLDAFVVPTILKFVCSFINT